MLSSHLKRREFIGLVGGAAAWPVVAHAEAAIPVIGFLHAGSPEPNAGLVAAFHKGLSEAGYVEGQKVAVEYRWAEGQYDRLAALAADLIPRHLAAIFAGGGIRSALAAKTATATIPIVFTVAADPAAAGLVASLNRPGGNVTGVNFWAGELVTKQLGLMREFVPAAKLIALLVNPNTPATDPIIAEVQTAADRLKLQLRVLKAGTELDFDEAFASLGQQPADALLVQTEPFLYGRLRQIIVLAARHAVPTIYSSREFAEAGGLVSYGASPRDAYRQAGLYIGRILKGEKPADLPVLQSSKFELVINIKTAKTLGLAVPDKLLAIADEVIE